MKIREATIRDADNLAGIRWRSSFPQDGEPSKSFTSQFRAFVAKAIKSGKWKIWIAEDAGQVIGNLYLQVIPKVPRPGQIHDHYGYITNVHVERRMRNMGCGEKMTKAAIAWGRKNGLEFAVLWPSKESVKFYKKNGFKRSPDALEFHYHKSA